jgi:hypothetical protein
MSITEQPQTKTYTQQHVADHPESHLGYGGIIAMLTGALGAAIALAGVSRGSLTLVVAAAILLGGWGFLTAANHKAK